MQSFGKKTRRKDTVLLGMLRSGYENNKVHQTEVGWEGADWIHFSEWGPVEGFCDCAVEASGSIRHWAFLTS
jgi:hypothetical protein